MSVGLTVAMGRVGWDFLICVGSGWVYELVGRVRSGQLKVSNSALTPRSIQHRL